MKVLVISAGDATNLSFFNVLIELVNRGHCADVYMPYGQGRAKQIFNYNGIKLYDISKLSNEVIKGYDLAFCGTDEATRLMFNDIYIFSYNMLLNSWTTKGSDFMFTASSTRMIRYSEICAKMPVGVPKNDTKRAIENQKQFLYIDAGHLPFSYKGKKQIAQMLLQICKNFPEYQLLVKPRWIPGVDDFMTHVNELHIYTVLKEITNGRLPDNLILLYEHKDLQELIDESETIISTSITCWLDAALRGKGVIIVDGYDSDEQYQLRKNITLKQDLSRPFGAGCVVNYMDINNYLPSGITISDEYLNEVFPCQTGASEKIVDVIEYIFNNILSEKKLPIITDYNYNDSCINIQPSYALDYQQLKKNRMKNSMIGMARFFDYIDADVGEQEYFEELDKVIDDYEISQQGHELLSKHMLNYFYELLVRNSNKLMDDPINQSYLLHAYFNLSKWESILLIDERNILCRGVYFYILGQYYKKEKFVDDAVFSFAEYLEDRMSRTYSKYLHDEKRYVDQAINYIFNNYNGTNLSDTVALKVYSYAGTRGLGTLDSTIRFNRFIPDLIKKNADNDSAIFLFNVSKRWVSELRTIKNQVVQPKLVKTNTDYYDRFKRNHFIRVLKAFKERVLPGYVVYKDLLEKYGTDSLFYLTSPGTGDAFIYGRLFNSFLKKEGNLKSHNVFIVFLDSSLKVAQMFSILDAYSLKLEQMQKLFSYKDFMGTKEKKIIYMHHHVFYRHIGMLANIEGMNGYDWATMALDYLGLSSEDIRHPHYIKVDEDYAISRGVAINNTVILSPYGKSVRSIPRFFWIKLARLLDEKGYMVLTNVFGEETPIEGTIGISESFDTFPNICEKAGAVVGLRSGVLDIISDSQCLIISLNNANNYKRGVTDVINAFSLRGISSNPNIYEKLYEKRKEDELINEIIALVKRYLKK